MHSRLAESESLKSDRTDPNTPVPMKYAYTVPERQTVVKYLAQVRQPIRHLPDPRLNRQTDTSTVIGSAVLSAATAINPVAPISTVTNPAATPTPAKVRLSNQSHL